MDDGWTFWMGMIAIVGGAFYLAKWLFILAAAGWWVVILPVVLILLVWADIAIED